MSTARPRPAAEAVKLDSGRGQTKRNVAHGRQTDRVNEARLRAAIERSRNGETDWKSLSYMMGRNELPDLLLFVSHTLPPDQLIAAVGDAWTGCEFPERAMHRRDWLHIFRAAGYHDDLSPAVPPTTLTLWRGGIKRTRMAWTADRDQAEWFQNRFVDRGLGPGKLWTVKVGADRLLAHYHAHHRSESEYVIDPNGLRPKQVG